MMSFHNEIISIVMRTTPHQHEDVVRAVFSIYVNHYPEKEVVLVYQGEDFADFILLQERLKVFQPHLRFRFVQNPTHRDDRAENLNLGIQEATGRYLSFLDDDDVLTPHGLVTLQEKLHTEKVAWVFGTIRLNATFKNGYIYKQKDFKYPKSYTALALLFDNCIPIHASLYDRNQIEQGALSVLKGLPYFEDYTLFLNLLIGGYTPTFIKVLMGYYQLKGEYNRSNKAFHDNIVLKQNALKVIDDMRQRLLAQNQIYAQAYHFIQTFNLRHLLFTERVVYSRKLFKSKRWMLHPIFVKLIKNK